MVYEPELVIGGDRRCDVNDKHFCLDLSKKRSIGERGVFR